MPYASLGRESDGESEMFERRVLSVILAVIMLFALAACAGPAKELAGETDYGNPMENADEKNDTVVLPSLDVGNMKEYDPAEKDNTQGSQGSQTAQDSTGGNGTAGDGEDGNETEGDPLAVAVPVFSAERERKYVNVEWKPVSYEKKVTPYKVNGDLSNVENAAQFGRFTDKQLKMLSDNGFVVIPATDEQLFFVYETNEYLKIPSFITVDSVLQTYHVFFDYSLRNLEYEYLLGDLEQLTGSMLKKSLALYDTIKNPEVKAAALRNTAYFATAQLALEKELPSGMPVEALELAKAEFKRISNTGGSNDLPSFKAKLDYSQFMPRGHYTRNHDFERFFRAMMWYGLFPFPFSDTETLQALLITYSLFTGESGTSDIDLWENIYDPTVFYVGSADDLTIYHYKSLIVKVYGQNPDPETFVDGPKFEKFMEEAEKLPPPLIQASAGMQFRFMGQRYIPDSEILQHLCYSTARPFPMGLDVMGVLGSNRAYHILTNVYDVNGIWEDYPKEFSRIKEKFDSLPDETWRSNLYYGWLWALKTFTDTFGNGYPTFMVNQAWQDKSLNTALASWAGLRHDTILYGKQSGSEGGGDEPPDPPPVIRGYVEPNVGVYERLLWLTKYSRENLSEREILPWALKYRMRYFEDLLQFLIDCSVKELRNEELTEEEYNRIQFYGGDLEYLTSSFADYGDWYEITSDTDKCIAVIADVHTAFSNYLEEGIGTASHIYVVVPIGGKLYLTRGAVFSYYEFVADYRLTDEEWQRMLKENKQPTLPEWTDSFTDAGVKGKIPIPADPYVSGS